VFEVAYVFQDWPLYAPCYSEQDPKSKVQRFFVSLKATFRYGLVACANNLFKACITSLFLCDVLGMTKRIAFVLTIMLSMAWGDVSEVGP
jgi:hypothetical protein